MSQYKQGYITGIRCLKEPEQPIPAQIKQAEDQFYDIIDTGQHDLEDWLLGYMAALRNEE